MRKIFVSLVGLGIWALPLLASAHVVVRPAEVGVGKFQTFTIGVPSEKEIATLEVRLVLPEGLEHVSPNVKPGWKIELKSQGQGEKAKVTEIVWRNGNIPEYFRDEFMFSAKVPATATTLIWKAYQTYEDGSVVAWDADPAAMKDMDKDDDESAAGPYSQTMVIDDLSGQQAAAMTAAPPPQSNQGSWALVLSAIALIVSIVAVAKSSSSRPQ